MYFHFNSNVGQIYFGIVVHIFCCYHFSSIKNHLLCFHHHGIMQSNSIFTEIYMYIKSRCTDSHLILNKSQFYFLFSLNQEGTLIPSIKSQFPLHKGVFNNIKFFHLFYLSCMYSKHVYVVHNKLFSFLICLLVFLPACACQPLLTSQIPINYTSMHV